MKNTIFLLGLVLLGTSCEDFLNRTPISDLTGEMQGIDPNAGESPKITNAEQAEAQLSGAYNAFGGEYYQLDYCLIGDAQSDNCYGGELKAQTMQLDEYSLDAGNGNVSRDWNYMYDQIMACNIIIKWTPLISDPALSETRKKEILGEASYIRAQCYFNLVRIYGGVPLRLTDIPTINDQNFEEVYPLLYPGRASEEDVYAAIFNDLAVAEANCAGYSANKFKITKPVVYSALAEVYATHGANWEKVKEYAQKVTSDTRYHLLSSFADVFKVENGDLLYTHSPESIFEVESVHNTSTGNWAYYMFVGTDWRKFCTPSLDLIRAFEAEGDAVRLETSILFDKATWNDQDFNPEHYPFAYKIQGADNVNIIRIRLPHVLLLEAEALNEMNDLEGSRAIVNQIRTRVQLPNTPAHNKATMRLAIEKERRLELAFEGYRWFDLKRTGRLYEVMNTCSDKQRQNAFRLADGKRWLWPVPQTQLDLNTALTQNPGY